MEKKKNYSMTRWACYFGYFTQAAVISYLPLLYSYFNSTYGVKLSSIALIAVGVFALQFAIDLSTPKLVKKLGYRRSALLAHFFAIIGFLLLSILPRILNPILGISISAFFYAIGSGLDEVIISPITENIPEDNKKGSMGLLHGMYCIGVLFVVLISTLLFKLLGLDNWWLIALFMAIIPLTAIILFIIAPIDNNEDTEEIVDSEQPRNKKSYLVLFLFFMLFSGATEQAIAQWASAYAEIGLNVDKTLGDLIGVAGFALTMAIFRIIYAKIADKYKTEDLLLVFSIIAIIGYFLASIIPNPIINLIGCMIAGIGVAPMWPATFSLAINTENRKDSKIFSLLALFGDMGCASGTYLIGELTNFTTMKYAVLIACIFPILFVTFIRYFKLKRKEELEKEVKFNHIQ